MAYEVPSRTRERKVSSVMSLSFMCVLYSARDVDESLFCAFFHAGLDTVPNPSQDHLHVLPGLRLRVQDHLVDGFVEVGVALLNLLLAHVYIIGHPGPKLKPQGGFFCRRKLLPCLGLRHPSKNG